MNMRAKSKLKAADNSSIYRKAKRMTLGCAFCPPHDGENRRRRPKPDKHKNKRR